MAGDGGGTVEASKSHGGEVTLRVRCFNGSKFSVQISLDSTVESLKSVIAQKRDVAAERLRLIYKGRMLKDDQTLESYGLEADHTVHLVRGFAPATSAVTKVASDPGVPNSTLSGMTSVGSSGYSACGGSGLGASFFSELGFNGLDEDSELAAGILMEKVHQRLAQNPYLMRKIIDMPSVNNAVVNQHMMQNVIMNDPQMLDLVDRNPELAHILNDPTTIRQTLENARNPELMREMMRNADRAMSNITLSPERLIMLRQIYENDREPFVNSTTRAGDAGNDLGSNLFSTDSETTSNSSAPNANPLPNPWASQRAGGAQMNSSTSLTPVGDVRLPAPGGLGGHLDYQPMFGSTQDTASLSQFMQNPAVSQTMQSLLSNPQYMNQVHGLNPQLRNVLDSNPQLKEGIQNPEFTCEQLSTLQQALHQQSTREGSQTNLVTDELADAELEMLTTMFDGLGTGDHHLTPDSPPEELYAHQLLVLEEMGFTDTRENLRVLIATLGNVHNAVERLLGNPDQSSGES